MLKREDKALPAGKAAAGPDADNKSAPAAALRWLAAKAIRAGTMPPAAPPAARAAAGWLGCRRQQVQQGVCGGSSVGGRAVHTPADETPPRPPATVGHHSVLGWSRGSRVARTLLLGPQSPEPLGRATREPEWLCGSFLDHTARVALGRLT